MPRLGVGMPITAGLSQEAVTTIDDFFFESFSAGEVHPILTASRTNLVTYSEDFSQWIADSVDTNVVTSPDGQTTADRINFSTTGALCRFITASGDPDGKTFTNSVFLKADTSTSVKIVILGSGGGLGFLSKTVTLNTEWQRFSVSQSFSGTGDNVRFRIESTEAGSIFAWGAQIEQDGFATEYIPTSGSTVTVSTTLNDTSNVWDFDGTDITLEADPEDEGFWEEGSNLVLNHDYEDLGSEQVTNGDFSADSDWTKGVGWTISGGTANGTPASNTHISQGPNNWATTGKIYKTVYTVSNYQQGTVKIQFSGGDVVSGTNRTANGTYTEYITATADHTAIRLKGLSANGGFIGSIDNLSVKQVDPNSRWSLGTGWSISDGKARYDASSGSSFTFLGQASLFPGAGDYQVTFTLGDLGGSFAYNHAGIVVNGIVNSFNGFGISSAGTHTVSINLDGSNLNLNFYGHTSGGDFSIDNATVIEYAIQPQDV